MYHLRRIGYAIAEAIRAFNRWVYNTLHDKTQRCPQCGSVMEAHGMTPTVTGEHYWGYRCTQCGRSRLL